MQRNPKFSVIVVNYNGGAYLARALKSLAAQTFRDFEVLLVDNASSDGSMENLDVTGPPSVRILQQTENLGFAAANNLAAREAKGEWLALLNPDAEAHPDWLEKILAASRDFPDCNQFACAQFHMDHPGWLDGAGDSYLIWGIPWRGGFGLPGSYLPPRGTCFSPCGASAVYRTETFRRFNGFDERMFCYCEDVDLGFRMQLAGEACIFLPEAAVEHAGSALSDKISDFAAFHGTRNRIWVYWKNMPPLLLALTLPGHLAISAYLLVRAWMRGTSLVAWKGMKAGVSGAGKLRDSDSPWAAPQRTVSLWHLSRTMAWNPFRISGRKPHVMPLKTSVHSALESDVFQ